METVAATATAVSVMDVATIVLTTLFIATIVLKFAFFQEEKIHGRKVENKKSRRAKKEIELIKEKRAQAKIRTELERDNVLYSDMWSAFLETRSQYFRGGLELALSLHKEETIRLLNEVTYKKGAWGGIEFKIPRKAEKRLYELMR